MMAVMAADEIFCERDWDEESMDEFEFGELVSSEPVESLDLSECLDEKTTSSSGSVHPFFGAFTVAPPRPLNNG